jgi:hypothetical protein
MHRYRRKALNAAWYDSPNDEPSNLPIALKNPFGKRNPTRSSPNNNDLHLLETGEPNVRALRRIRTDPLDYRPTAPQDRARELRIGDPKPHKTTTPNVDTAHDIRNEQLKIPRSDSPLNADYTADKVERVQEQRVHDPISSETAVAHEFVGKSPLDKNHEGMYQRNRGTVAKIAAKFHKKSEYIEDEDEEFEGRTTLSRYVPLWAKITALFHKRSGSMRDKLRYEDSTSEDQMPPDVEKGPAKPTLSFKVLRMSLVQKKGDSQGVSEIRESNLDIADKHFESRVEGRRAVTCLSLDVGQDCVALFGRSPLSKLKVL